MPRRMPLVFAVCIGLLLLFGGRAEAQDGLSLGFRPAPGSRVQTLWWFEIQSRIGEGEGAGEAVHQEIAGVRSLTSRVVAARDGARTVEVVRDSLRVRKRVVGGDWIPKADTAGPRPTARLTVDERLRIVRAERLGADTAQGRVPGSLRAFAAGVELAFPGGSVRVGDTWTSEVVVPIESPTGAEEDRDLAQWVVRAGEITARTTFTLDSIVPRGIDTLAYLGMTGAFLPTTVPPGPEAAGISARVTGAFSGRLIWSTGWNAFVSGAIRTRTRLQTYDGPSGAEPAAVTLDLDTSTRFQVRQ